MAVSAMRRIRCLVIMLSSYSGAALFTSCLLRTYILRLYKDVHEYRGRVLLFRRGLKGVFILACFSERVVALAISFETTPF